jgi:Ca2+-binding RTX toxin-like protein
MRNVIASAVALALVVLAGGSGHAAAALTDYSKPPPLKKYRFEPPRLEQGLLQIKGTPASDRIALRLQAGQPAMLQVDFGDDSSADFTFVRADVTRIAVDARAGSDLVRIDDSNGAFTDTIPATIYGGAGRDTLLGGAGRETLRGGPGRDSIDGNRGNDVAFMGSGDDTFIWDPGDGSDTIEGQSGYDTMLFNGANVAERIDMSANGYRLRFFRDAGNITMDTDGVERVDFNALGGVDIVTVNDLRATDVRLVRVDLAATGGGGDGAADRVVVNGTDRNDRIDVSGDAARVRVRGLAARVEILRSEAANDRLELNTLAGSDTVSRALAPGSLPLFVDGVLVQ